MSMMQKEGVNSEFKAGLQNILKSRDNLIYKILVNI